MTMAISMFVYCLLYLNDKVTKKTLIIQAIVAGIGLTLCFLLPLEKRIREFKNVDGKDEEMYRIDIKDSIKTYADIYSKLY